MKMRIVPYLDVATHKIVWGIQFRENWAESKWHSICVNMTVNLFSLRYDACAFVAALREAVPCKPAKKEAKSVDALMRRAIGG